MAQDSTPVKSDAASQADEESKAQGFVIAKLTNFLKNYKGFTVQDADTLEDRYTVNLSQPLPEFDHEFAKAYAAQDKLEPGKLLFAHICQWGKTQRYHVISLLKNSETSNIVPLLAAGNVTLSTTDEERFTIIYERPSGIRLSELLKKKKIPLNLPFIYEHILAPLIAAIQQFVDLDISHGLINTDNIYISDMAVLGPCVAEPCGYSQPFQFEPVERIQAMPFAKGEGSTAQDYYALAIVLLHILHGPDHLARYNKESLVSAILRHGAYNALMLDKDVPEVLYDFLRGALTLNAEDRWGCRQVNAWLGGKRFHVLPPPAPMEAVRPYELGDLQAHTRRELANIFCSNWQQMLASLNNNQLAHWVSVSLRNKELSDMVTRLSRTAYDLGNKNENAAYGSLMNLILLLDPAGPVRLQHLAMHIDGLDSLCAELYFAKANTELQILAQFLESNMINYWIDLQTKMHKSEYVLPNHIHTLNIKMDRLRGYMRHAGYGFGLERMLYDLNPEMGCISPLLAKHNVRDLTELLICLDRIAIQFCADEDPLDNHIAAFITSKLNIVREVRLDALSSIPSLATNRTLQAIYLLGLAQLRLKSLRLSGLTHWLVMRALPSMDSIHSRTLRHKYKAALLAQAPQGNIPSLADLIVSADYAENDYLGFQEALAAYRNNANTIAHYEAAENVEAEAMQMGYNISRMVGYICLMGSIYLCVKGVL